MTNAHTGREDATIIVCCHPEKGHVAQPLDFSSARWFKSVNVENNVEK